MIHKYSCSSHGSCPVVGFAISNHSFTSVTAFGALRSEPAGPWSHAASQRGNCGERGENWFSRGGDTGHQSRERCRLRSSSYWFGGRAGSKARDCYLMCGCPGAAVTKPRRLGGLTDRTLMLLTALQPGVHSQGVLGHGASKASGRVLPASSSSRWPPASPQPPSPHGLSPVSETRTQPP